MSKSMLFGSLTRALLSLAGAALLVAACGGPQQALTRLLTDADETPYSKRCADATAAHQRDLSSGAYNPASLFVHRWPDAGGAQPFVAESRLIAALDAGEVKRVLILARGGLGKTRLSQAILAQSCGDLPTFAIDLKDVAAAGQPAQGRNAVIEAIARSIEVRPEGREALLAALASQRFLVLLDSIEEVALASRGLVVEQVEALAQKYPHAQTVLLARPPVLDADYGFTGIDARIEIPPLDCKVADAFVARAQSRRATPPLQGVCATQRSR